ncbi:MAG: metal ABC transporter substrate-binding protein [Candidatus Caldarchaeum sp.]|nr:metal ABC transporter substrate-binding protein [Candidatus Caldarchaeum sp.]
MQRRVTLIMALLLVGAAVFGSAVLIALPDQTPKERVIAVTWGLLGEIVHRLTDGQVKIFQILPPNVELHHWEPTPDVVENLRGASVLLWTLEDLDGWAVRIASAAGVQAYRVTSQITFLEGGNDRHRHEHGDGHDHEHGVDVHFWHDPKNVAQLVKNIAQVLVNTFPDKRDLIERNKSALLAELEQLDREIASKLAPYKGRIFVTQHDAFRYLAKAYGLESIAVFTVHEEEPSAAHLAEVYETIENHGIKTIFAEDDRVYPLLSIIAKDKGLKVGMLYTGENLLSDGYKRGQGYVDMMRKNVDALVKSFAE